MSLSNLLTSDTGEQATSSGCVEETPNGGGLTYDSISKVAATASSTVLGCFCFMPNATWGGVSCWRNMLIASCSRASSWSVGYPLSARALRSSAKSAHPSVAFLRHAWNSAWYRVWRLSGSKWAFRAAFVVAYVPHEASGRRWRAFCARPITRTRSHLSLSSSVHPFMVATLSKWKTHSSQSLLPSKVSGSTTGLAGLGCGRPPPQAQQKQLWFLPCPLMYPADYTTCNRV